jgi:hypothetical protein
MGRPIAHRCAGSASGFCDSLRPERASRWRGPGCLLAPARRSAGHTRESSFPDVRRSCPSWPALTGNAPAAHELEATRPPRFHPKAAACGECGDARGWGGKPGARSWVAIGPRNRLRLRVCGPAKVGEVQDGAIEGATDCGPTSRLNHDPGTAAGARFGAGDQPRRSLARAGKHEERDRCVLQRGHGDHRGAKDLVIAKDGQDGCVHR